MIRIVAGRLRGRKLKVPHEKITRPTTNRVRESLFSLVDSYLQSEDQNWADLRVLDAFAGSGALGLEAYSRGANFITFVDQSYEACTCIADNIQALKIDPSTLCLYKSTLSKSPLGNSPLDKRIGVEISTSDCAYDLVFLDPPYKSELIKTTLSHLKENQLIHQDTLLVLEVPKDMELDLKGWCLKKQRLYGQTHVFLLTLPQS